jgi:dTDP-4-dehydrorhamnose reductase
LLKHTRLLITGHSGMLGSELAFYFNSYEDYEVFGLGRSKTNILSNERQYIFNLESFKSEQLEGNTFDIIIHTAALTDINLCESNKQLADRLNIDASVEIAKLAKSCNAKLFYISTDSVFNGTAGNYNETEIPSPLNYYAFTKYNGELKVMDFYEKKSLIVRTNIYGLNQPFRNTIVEWALKEWAKNKQINGFEDVYFNALYTGQLASILKNLIELNVEEKILNIGSSEFISKYDFLNKLRLKFGFENGLLKKSKSLEFISNIKRPLNTTLNLSKLEKILDIPTFEDGINKLANKFRNI